MNKRFLKHLSDAKKSSLGWHRKQVIALTHKATKNMILPEGDRIIAKNVYNQQVKGLHNTAKYNYLKEVRRKHIIAASIGGVVGTAAIAVGLYNKRRRKTKK